ncbi:MAG: hypothetical protein ABGX16_06015 [Pirellulales bacterium]
MKTQYNRLLAILVLGFALVPSERACAQRARKYQPARPTTSPYLNLLRTNVSGVPNYYSFVRPQQKQREINLNERSIRQRQARTLGKIENTLQQGRLPIQSTGSGSGFMLQGTRSTFMTPSRYYPQSGPGNGRAR